jgi:hypothetical protein
VTVLTGNNINMAKRTAVEQLKKLLSNPSPMREDSEKLGFHSDVLGDNPSTEQLARFAAQNVAHNSANNAAADVDVPQGGGEGSRRVFCRPRLPILTPRAMCFIPFSTNRARLDHAAHSLNRHVSGSLVAPIFATSSNALSKPSRSNVSMSVR